ncbi:MAG: acyl-CoA dehydrogenase [Motiliproteus sp.]
MLDYKTPVQDLLYTLKQGANAERLPGWDDALAQEVINQAARLIDGEIAPLDQLADSHPARLEDGDVVLSDGFVDAYENYVGGGWSGLTAPEAYGGQALPEVLGAALQEALSGACVSFQMLLSLGQGAMRALFAHADERQRARYLPPLVSGEWLATMCMTESVAGSDLGLLRTTAKAAEDGSWRLQGEKIFITGGGQNLTGNIVHLVLARVEGAAPGVRGLSLFICPKMRADGRPNQVSVLRLEQKMGLHASPTCQLLFDGAEAEMLGQPGEGLACMFTMMNAERLDVAAQGVGLADVATQRSWAYAHERRQGRAPGGQSAADRISAHGDVQRMLLMQKALTQGSRALLYRTSVELQLDPGSPLVALLTPVCKAFCSEAGVRAADLAIQIHGGYGYCKEFRVEQIFRDARITTIYEGSNGIQAMTLCGRLLKMADGACIQAFQDDLLQAIEVVKRASEADMANVLGKALSRWQQATQQVVATKEPGPVAEAYMRLTGLTAFGAAWARLLAGAEQAPQPDVTRALANYVAQRMLPECDWLADSVIRCDSYALTPASVFAPG